MKKILVLHGPNLNLLGSREPNIYGKTSLGDLNQALIQRAQEYDMHLNTQQSNSEGEIITFIHEAAQERVDYIIFNPAAFTHTSIALRDAIQAVGIPFIEVHISNIFNREPFRQSSYFSDIAQGVIAGLGTNGYFLALEALSYNK
jgi:3-dehydroquinate dehydratase-2